jgi:hypothetical protein
MSCLFYFKSTECWRSGGNWGRTELPPSHYRMFLRGLGSRVLELGGESGTDRHPTVYPGSYVEYVQKLGHEAPGIYS